VKTSNLVVALVGIALAGCAAARPEPPPLPFTGTKWTLAMEVPLEGEQQPWVRFGDGRVQGFFGCNEVLGNYQTDTVGARAIAIGRVERSGRLCDASVVATERRLLEVFQSVSSYSITVDTMVMVGSGGALTFKGPPPSPAPK
jgi:heat shock protein HslJ